MRVVIADDVLIVRAGLKMLLEASGVLVVGEASDGEQARAEVALTSPDVAIVDIRMPPTYTDEGLRTADAIRRFYPGTAVLVLSQYVDPVYARRLFEQQHGGVGYLLKQRVQDSAVLLEALERVAAGGCVVDESIATVVARRSRATEAIDALTDREVDVLQLMAQGRSNAAIAHELGIANKSVEALVTGVFRALGLESSSDTNRRVLAVLRLLAPPERES